MRALVVAIIVAAAGRDVAGAPDGLPPLISWRAPVGCGDETTIRARIAERSGRSTADGNEPYAVGCGIEGTLEVLRRALDGRHPENAGFLRDDALLLVVFVTNEDDNSPVDGTKWTEPVAPLETKSRRRARADGRAEHVAAR